MAIALRAASGSTMPGTSSEGAQRDEDAGGFGRGQPQRMVDTGGERDFDCVAGEFEVDEVAGAVAGQAAHPQLVEVVAQLLDADTEVGGGFGVGDPRVGLEVRHHVEQPDQPGATRRSRVHLVVLAGLCAQSREDVVAQRLGLEGDRVGP